MEHLYERRVAFADTDAAGVVHFSRILCYAEEAEHDLLGKLGIPLLGDGGWPRVHVECDYRAPARLGDALQICISPGELGTSSVAWKFTISCAGQTIATGSMKTVLITPCRASRPASSW